MLTQFPKSIQAGLSLAVTIEAPDYPAPTWSISALIRGPVSIDLVATGDGGTHSFSVSAADTQSYAAGTYTVSVRANDGVDVVEIESGRFEIHADIAGLDSGHDPRAHAERVLDSINAVIEGRATKDQSQYTIAGRTLVRTPIAELLQLQRTYEKKVAAIKSGGRSRRLLRRKVRTHF